MVSAGWVLDTETTPPGKMGFDRQVVDFHRFLEEEPESDYNGAMSTVAVTGSAIAAIVCSFMF